MKQPTTTLNEIREHGPCSDGWKNLLSYLKKTEADDEPLPFLTILESNGFEDTIWAMRVQPNNPLWRHFAVDCAERVKHLMEDQRSLDALVVARKHALGEASNSELHAACCAAKDAAWGASWRASCCAAEVAAEVASWGASWDAAKTAAWASACADERTWQTERLRDLLTWGEWRPVEQDL